MTRIADCITNCSNWLEKIQFKQGKDQGGWGEYQGSDPNCLNTSETIIALVKSNLRVPGCNLIQDAVSYLIDQQLSTLKGTCTSKLDCGSWAKIIVRDNSIKYIPDTVRTAYALLALDLTVEAGSSKEQHIKFGVDWLKEAQREDGGWGYQAKNDLESELFPTCLSLQALVYICCDRSNTFSNDLYNSINHGFQYLISLDRGDGSFGNAFGSLRVSHTLYAIETLYLRLEKDRNNAPDIYRGHIQEAIKWINQQRNDVISWSSELIKLEPDDPRASGNYTFSHNNPALYLSIISPISNVYQPMSNVYQDENANLTRDSLIFIKKNLYRDINNYGFCGTRPVSWATAKTLRSLAAIQAIRPQYPPDGQFPELEPISASAPILGNQQILFLFILFLCIVVAFLTYFQRTNTIVIAFFLIAIFVLLLIYGYLSESGLIKLLKYLWTTIFS